MAVPDPGIAAHAEVAEATVAKSTEAETVIPAWAEPTSAHQAWAIPGGFETGDPRGGVVALRPEIGEVAGHADGVAPGGVSHPCPSRRNLVHLKCLGSRPRSRRRLEWRWPKVAFGRDECSSWRPRRYLELRCAEFVPTSSLIRVPPIATKLPQNEPSFEDTAAWLKRRAGEIGFGEVGIAPAVEATGASRLSEWLELGHHGEMHYLREREAAYGSPQSVLEGARTLVLLTLDYFTGDAELAAPGVGRVARYAWGEVDYHDLIHQKLEVLKSELEQRHPGAAIRGVVDTAPLLEREYAELCGLGWRGKNTLLLSPKRGSYFFLACLLTSLDLPVDAPTATDHCGTCTACLDACPTEAFVAPNLLDAQVHQLLDD